MNSTVCVEEPKILGLVVEIDGSSYNNKKVYDAQRQHYLENIGLKVYRILNNDIKKNLELAMQDLEKYIIEQYDSTYEPARKLTIFECLQENVRC